MSEFKKWSEDSLAYAHLPIVAREHLLACYKEIDRARQACAGLRGLANKASQYQSERDQARAEIAALKSSQPPTAQATRSEGAMR